LTEPKDKRKKAIEMLLNGATLLSEPCPYCKGVRVMKDGHALCVNCGKEPEKSQRIKDSSQKSNSTLEILEKKLTSLSEKFAQEHNNEKQQKILELINSLIETIERLKK